jgi:hypothetical protein
VPEVTEVVQEAVEKAHESRLNSWIALLVAITAVLMALCNIKDGNVVQAMSQAQAHGVDAWSYFQSKSTKQHLASNSADQLETQLEISSGLPAEVRRTLEGRLAKYRGQVKQYAAEKDSIQKQAEGFAAEYDRLNVHDDQFDMADAAFSISVALYGITALTRRRWLLGMAVAATLFGAFSGACGFLGLSFHPSWLTGWLG